MVVVAGAAVCTPALDDGAAAVALQCAETTGCAAVVRHPLLDLQAAVLLCSQLTKTLKPNSVKQRAALSVQLLT